MSKTQSVILNLNKNYANSEASNYFQPVAQQLDIGKDASVCLYGASIKRQPLVIGKDKPNNTFNFQIGAVVFPDARQSLNATNDISDVLDEAKLPESLIGELALGYQINAGGFSVQEFGQTMVNNINATTTNLINGDNIVNDANVIITCGGLDLVKQFPYSYIFDNSKDDFYLGFQGVPVQRGGFQNDVLQMLGKLNNSQIFNVDNTESFRTTGALELDYQEESNNFINGCRKITANTSISTTDYQAFSQIHSAPVFPLFRTQSQNPKPILQAGQNESFFEFGILADESDNNKETDFIVGFTNTFLQSSWATSSVPATTTLFPEADSIPQTFLGVRVKETIQSGDIDEAYIDIYLANKITQYEEYLDNPSKLQEMWQDGCSRVAKVDLAERIGEAGKMGFRFYAVDNQYNFYKGQTQQLEGFAGSINPNGSAMYPRVYGFQFYFRPIAGSVEVVYDSKHDNIFIPSYYLEDGFCFNAARSQRDPNAQHTNLGFQPYLFVNKLEAGDGICSPRGNYIAHKDNDGVGNIIYRYGMDHYEYISKNKDFNAIMGINLEKTEKQQLKNLGEKWDFLNAKRFDGNAYPEFKQLGGNVRLYNDNTEYNIELNLPITAYNTTEIKVGDGAKRVPGQKRTILYKTDPVLEGEVEGVNQYLVNKNIIPNNLKFLTLNNSQPLNVNELNVQIRRAKTNELATELEDASVELLIKSE